MKSQHEGMKHALVTFVKKSVSTQLRQIMNWLPVLH